MIKCLHHDHNQLEKSLVPAHFEWAPEFFLHCPRAPKWLMQCSSNIPQGVAFPEVLISAPRIVQTDSEEAMGRQNNMETVLKPNHLTFTSKHDDVIYYLPYGSRYHRSKIFSSHGTDHFSFTHISAKLLEPCSFI